MVGIIVEKSVCGKSYLVFVEVTPSTTTAENPAMEDVRIKYTSISKLMQLATPPVNSILAPSTLTNVGT